MGCNSSNMGTQAVARGPLGLAVAANVRGVRERRRLTMRQLADRLGELGRPMQPSGIAKIEARDRRVDVDDLVALAVALNVSPARLLLRDADAEDEVRLLEAVTVPAWSAWQWGTGQHALVMADDDMRDPNLRKPELEFHEESPVWLRSADMHPLGAAARELLRTVRLAVAAPSPVVARAWLRHVARAVDAVQAASEQLAEEVAARGDG